MGIYYVWQRDVRLMGRMKNSFTLAVLGAVIALAIFAPTINQMLSGILVGTTMVSYLQFYVPSSLLVAAFTASFYGGGSVQHDRREGMLRVMASSALSRTSLALGKILGAATRALIIVVSLLVVISLAGFRFVHPLEGLLGVLGMSALISWCFGAVSVFVAFSIRHRFGYDLIITSLVAPLTYIAALTYPEHVLPGYLLVLAHLNPLTYAANGAREMVVEGTLGSPINLLVPLILAICLTCLTVHTAQNLTGDQLLAP